MTYKEAVEKYGSKRAAAKELGIAWTTFRRLYTKESQQSAVAEPSQADLLKEKCSAYGFDASDVTGAWLKSKDATIQVKKKKASGPLLTEDMIQILEKARTTVVRKPQHSEADSMLVVSIHDAHFAKLAYHKEAGQDYDPDITATLYRQAVADSLAFFNPTRIKQIVFPIGSDLLHTDNMAGTTTSGTPVESVDTRATRVFDVAMAAVISALEDCISVADVYAPVVPGNHDYFSSILLAKAVKQYFKDDPRIVVDDDEISRKYFHWGKNLICFSHKFTKLDRAPVILALEAPEAWANSICREVHTGHTHRRHADRYTAYSESAGVVVRVLPSLSCADKYHYDNGFVGNLQAAESHLYSYSDGFLSSFVAKARTHDR